jgi:hypothetical protein
MAREVDRLLAGLANLGTQAGHEHRPPEAATRRDHIALWARVLLGIVLGGMMTQWPSVHDCGLPLLEYLGAVAMVMVTGTWIAVVSWGLRNAPSHILALLLLLWGLVLAAGQVLPRIGYAVQRLTWHC